MTPTTAWLRIARESDGADPAYRARLAVLLLTSFLASPLRLLETALYSRCVRGVEFKPPLMILGYGRSGTTHLHNLLVQDPNHGSVTTLQAIVPTFFLLARKVVPEGLLSGLVPSTRPMDNVRVALDLPQEEEVAIANSTHMSFLHHLSFPRNARRLHRRYTLMEGLTDRERAHWGRVYTDIVRKAAFHQKGRRIVLKSPTNLARIPEILRIFPETRFVNIVRNPYTVYLSLVNMFRVLLPQHQVQDIEWEAMEESIIYAYKANMTRYIEDRSLIPAGRLVEMRFEDLEADPVAELQRVYRSLGLDGWDAAKGPVSAYLGTLREYRKNRFEMDAADVERVNTEWGFALEEWGYERPEVR
jgi:hypothetical protein